MWEVHSTGAVWAEFLFVMTEDLIAKHGFSHELFPPAPIDDNSTPSEVEAHRHFYNTSSVTGKHYPAQGNTLGLQLVIDGMKVCSVPQSESMPEPTVLQLQPCRPNFLSARDAILAADHALTGGSNYCIILNSFTKRGAGIKAAVRGSTPWGGGFREEDYELPHKCKKSLA